MTEKDEELVRRGEQQYLKGVDASLLEHLLHNAVDDGFRLIHGVLQSCGHLPIPHVDDACTHHHKSLLSFTVSSFPVLSARKKRGMLLMGKHAGLCDEWKGDLWTARSHPLALRDRLSSAGTVCSPPRKAADPSQFVIKKAQLSTINKSDDETIPSSLACGLRV